MDIQLLEKRFALMGARVKIGEASRFAREGINIRQDNIGEFFDIRVITDEKVAYEVIDLRKDLRHLLLMARRENAKEKFLCGHDERHWFVCAVPGESVASVTEAMRNLQPDVVQNALRLGLKREKNRLRRHNEVFVRQGEWFFLPMPDMVADGRMIFRNEPLSRGAGSKPHICEEVFRTSGESVMVCSRRPTGLTLDQYFKLLKSNPKAKNWGWQQRVRGAAVYARGSVRHNDHKTVYLDVWHRVLMNTEGKAPWSRNVVFLD